MPKLLRDFKCEDCGQESERFIDIETHYVRCPKCNGKSYKMVGMPRVALDGTDPGFPGAYSRWADVREKNARQKASRDT